MCILPSRSRRQMWPLPLVKTPSLGCHAGPSPPEPSEASTLSLASGSKIVSWAMSRGDKSIRANPAQNSLCMAEASGMVADQYTILPPEKSVVFAGGFLMEPAVALAVVVSLLGTASSGVSQEKPRVFDVWPGKAPGENGKIGDEKLL